MNRVAFRFRTSPTAYTTDELALLRGSTSSTDGSIGKPVRYPAVRQEIEHIAGNRIVPQAVKEEALHYLDRFDGKGLGCDTSTAAGVLLYLAHLAKGLPVQESDFVQYATADAMRDRLIHFKMIDVKSSAERLTKERGLRAKLANSKEVAFRKARKRLQERLQLKLEKPKAMAFIDRLADELKIAHDVREGAKEILTQAQKHPIASLSNMKPSGVAAAALYGASLLLKGQGVLTRYELAMIADASEVTISRVARELIDNYRK